MLQPLRRSIFVSVIALCLVPPAIGADGWPFIRGPDFDAHSSEKGLADSWPDKGPPILWSRNLGQGYSAFVAKQDRVFTQAQNMTGQYLYCLEAYTGRTIWEYRYDWPYEAAGVYPGPRSTPTLVNDRVFFTSPDGLLACLDEHNGRLIWSVDLLETYGIEGCDFGYACSPTVVDGLVILPVGGKDAGVVAFDSLTGKQAWQTSSQPASYTPAYPIELNGEPLVVCYMQNALLILNRTTGQLKREIELSHGYDEHSAWPIYREPFLWLSAPFRAGSYLVDLTDIDDTTTELPVVWRSKTMSNDICSSVLVGDQIYGFDIYDVQSKTHRPSRGIFRCLEFETGKEHWAVGNGRPRRVSNADDFRNDIGQCGIIAADEKLIVLNELGELILLKADPTACVELTRCSVLSGELTWTPPCLNEGRLYIRNQTRAVCIYLGDPRDLGDISTMNADDLPQHQYYNLAAMILAVEPEYAFDIPHDRWLVLWFFAGLGILVVSKLFLWTLRSSEPHASPNTTLEFVTVASAGAIGTTILGYMTAEFVFTWHVSLYAALEYVAASSAPAKTENRSWSAVRRRIPLAAFLSVSLLYFLACRRLSLVFEWAFLAGYPGAIPIVWLFKRTPRFATKRRLPALVASLIGYTFFFATAVAFLKSRY